MGEGTRVVPPAAGMRYHDLDALRGVFMLIGVFVHVSTLGDEPIFDGVVRASGLFRMEGFFVISGFFAAMLTEKYGFTPAVRRRLAVVGAPLLSTLILFNPPTLWMIYRFHSGRDIAFDDYLRANIIPALTGGLDWYLHLWFLIVLLGYALLIPVSVLLLRRLVAARIYRSATAGRRRTMTAIMFLMLAAMTVIRAGWTGVVEPVFGSDFHTGLVRHGLEFLPFFLLGLLLYLDRIRLMPSFQHPAPVLLAVTGLILLASWREWIGVLSADTGRALAETMFTIPLLATIFAVAGRFVSRPRPVVRYLADASYTVYLIHFFWIYVFATLLGLDPGLGFAHMLLLVIATFGATFTVHHFVVLRSSFLRKILNGKFPPKIRDAGGSPTAVPLSPSPSAIAVAAVGGHDAEPAQSFVGRCR